MEPRDFAKTWRIIEAKDSLCDANCEITIEIKEGYMKVSCSQGHPYGPGAFYPALDGPGWIRGGGDTYKITLMKGNTNQITCNPAPLKPSPRNPTGASWTADDSGFSGGRK